MLENVRDLLEEAEEWLRDSEFAPARDLAQRIKLRLAEETLPEAVASATAQVGSHA